MSSPTNSPPRTYFPLLRFSSLLGVHTLLLLFTALFLPRSTFLLSAIPPQASSRDKPQHPFLSALTADPAVTLVWLCLGVGFVQGSWASWVKLESDNARMALFGEDEEARLKRAMNRGDDKLQVSQSIIVIEIQTSLGVLVHERCDSLDSRMLNFYSRGFNSLRGTNYRARRIVDSTNDSFMLNSQHNRHFLKTFLLATILSLLLVFPSVYTLRSPSLGPSSLVHRMMWIRLFAELSPKTAHERLLVYPTVGAALGAWLGVFPIALDWDRPWQAWPLTPAYGAITGHIVGSWVSLIYSAILSLAEVDRSIGEGKMDARQHKRMKRGKTATKKTKPGGGVVEQN
ncbi:PIG-F-domain-containing protein [Fomitiporia mediterranea MF3/22]|uniref:PIG-F-domain-containing protein n=1 Tax=Fomitiporia mediterranea (strain MF3/22) TaxID=694068 RepID=UPI000440892A|nr:PIG-F-domain-containing protein [Fomitiporia mediterranea MF3/22]EJD07638.1 PIG-F-domain-containing protein [Fomitiporia mediterranea MF3/22]